jgi:hypothetical protein
MLQRYFSKRKDRKFAYRVRFKSFKNTFTKILGGVAFKHNYNFGCNVFTSIRAVAQAVSRLLPAAAAWVRAQVRSCGICGGQRGTGGGFLRVLRISLPILIPYSSSSTIRGWYIGQIVADVPSGLSLTPPTPRNYCFPNPGAGGGGRLHPHQ